MIGEIRIIEAAHMTESATREVPRTLRERLFSWPWRPLQRTRTEVYQKPMAKAFLVGDTLMAHPVVAGALRDALTAHPRIGLDPSDAFSNAAAGMRGLYGALASDSSPVCERCGAPTLYGRRGHPCETCHAYL